ncbi:glycerophosphodiester phosphodiesterase family protein [Pleionea sediminis]|uniref:glycerophosphodiester phosphodiesterase family protein n=1 Tax=Pleionea sediminis TaxID=2569479 RepID=UPI001184EDB7|nr:glycerophosphodiester phosphodiesterase family protein [Pleionea sediminis]
MALKLHFTDFPKIIAHRGLSAKAPENTLAAFHLAADHSIQWVETDVRLSKDQIPMLFHDAVLPRTTNGSGTFNDFTFEQLKLLDAGKWFSDEFMGEQIPSLDELLDLGLERNIGLNLEIKPNLGEEQITAEQIALLIQERAHNPKILFSSYCIDSLRLCQEYLPRIPRALVVDDFELMDEMATIAQTEALGCSSLHINHQLIYSNFIAQCHYAPFDIMCFTVNDHALAEKCWQAGCVSIFSDTGLIS